MDDVVPDSVQDSDSSNDIPDDADTQSSEDLNSTMESAIASLLEEDEIKQSEIVDDVEEDLDDNDVSEIDSNELPKNTDLEYDYSDDELIDMAIDGKSFD